MRRLILGLWVAALSTSGLAAADLKSRLATLEVGDVIHDEKTGVALQFLQKNAGAPGEGGWVRAESLGCGFKILMPGPFNELKQEVPAVDGARITLIALGSPTAEGAKFTVTCTRRSDDRFPDNFVSLTLDGMARSNEVLERREVTRRDRKFTHMSFRGRDSIATVELARLENVVFQLIVEYPPSASDSTPALAEKFFASLEP